MALTFSPSSYIGTAQLPNSFLPAILRSEIQGTFVIRVLDSNVGATGYELRNHVDEAKLSGY